MKALLVAAVLVLAIPAAAAQTTLQGHLQASAVAADQTSDVTGKGLFIGFTQQHDRAAVDWSVTADTALVDITSYPSVVYAEAVAFPGGNPRHDTQTYTQASITRTLGTKPAANDFEFWMMVTPLPGHTATGFGLAGQLPTRDLVAQSSIFYICDPVAPAPTVMPTRQDSSGTGEVVYRDPQQALEWKPWSATGPFVVTGDFVLSVFQADFQATGHDGRTDHYSTGDPTTGFDPQAPTALPPAVANDEKTRADITVHGGSLVLLPNGRDLQLDVAGLATQVHLGIDFADAKGSLQDAAGESPLEGHVLVDANDLALTLMPANGRIATTFSGTVNGVAVDGRPVHLAPGTATAVAHAPASLLAAFAVGFLLAAGIFTVLAVRKKTDKALLLARAQAYFEVGRHKAALRVCRRLLRLDPRNVDAATVAAMSLVRLGRASEANSLLKAGLAGAEHQGLLSMVEALVLFHQGDARTAAARLQEAFNAYPSLHNELAAVDLLDQLLVHVAESSPLPQVVSP